MTMLRMCSIYDCKAEAWLTPMFFQAKGQAIRSFSDAVNGESEFAKHPDDYTLFCLGTFDDSCGEFKLEKTPESLGLGVNFLRGAE